MKKALIIIGAVFAGLALLAIVGSMLPSDEPQKVVIVQETIAETPLPSAEPAVVLTSKEQRVYDFIQKTYPKVDRLFNQTLVTIDNANSEKALGDLVDDSTTYIELAKGWEKLDWAGGEVRTLETAFGTYMVATRRFYKNWLNGTIGGGDTTQCAKNAVAAQVKAEKWAPRVEDELVDLGIF